MKSIVITISEVHLSRLSFVADELRKEGLQITNLFEFGVITGHAEEQDIEKMRCLAEVASLTEDRQVRIAPPDSGIQ